MTVMLHHKSEFESDLPNCVDLEQALLGALLLDNGKLDEVAGFLDAEPFYEPLHAEIYRVIRRLAEEGRSYTPITLAPFFKDAPPVGKFTVPEYLVRLAAGVRSLLS